jgi:hypothetical protein
VGGWVCFFFQIYGGVRRFPFGGAPPRFAIAIVRLRATRCSVLVLGWISIAEHRAAAAATATARRHEDQGKTNMSLYYFYCLPPPPPPYIFPVHFGAFLGKGSSKTSKTLHITGKKIAISRKKRPTGLSLLLPLGGGCGSGAGVGGWAWLAIV